MDAIQVVAYGTLGLKPEEFWAISPREYNVMVEGVLDRMEYERNLLAAHAVVVVKGTREKKPNLSQIVRRMVGNRPVDNLSEEQRLILEESNARVPTEVREQQLQKRFQEEHEIASDAD